jgi:hypothetical protein
VEDYNSALNLKLRSDFLKSKGLHCNRDVVRAAMKGKLRDSVHTTNEVTRRRDELRRQIKKTYGPRTVTTRKILKTFRQEAEEITRKTKDDYKNKIDHLKAKHEKLRREERGKVPDDVIEYQTAVAFDSDKFEKIEIEEISVTVIGDVKLSEDEMAVLRLHPKFSVREEVTPEKMDLEQELG